MTSPDPTVRPPTLSEIDAVWHRFAAVARRDPVFWRGLVRRLDARLAELASRKAETKPMTTREGDPAE